MWVSCGYLRTTCFSRVKTKGEGSGMGSELPLELRIAGVLLLLLLSHVLGTRGGHLSLELTHVLAGRHLPLKAHFSGSGQLSLY